MIENVTQWHDWAFCPCCGFYREVLITAVDLDVDEVECTTCGFAWISEPEPDPE